MKRKKRCPFEININRCAPVNLKSEQKTTKKFVFPETIFYVCGAENKNMSH